MPSRIHVDASGGIIELPRTAPSSGALNGDPSVFVLGFDVRSR